ncbi:hypothetical protein [Verrucomicrobium spinosum]|uniref:hypothetical protein n=1 Tax=Verrucomicrobium spinosum TaxID=2736 RepID=UPI00094618FC|nr:hypothetical protein [Verrucomicrobium spinosum]
MALAASAAFAQTQTLTPVAANITSESASLGALSVSRQTLESQTAPPAFAPLPRVFAPTLPRTTYTRYPWKTDIVATVFWVGELPTENNPTPNTASSWDTQWTASFGGYDDPDPSRRAPDYRPAGFVPKQNPFYVALPYNDCIDYKTTKATAARFIPWFKEKFRESGKSVCRDRWIAIRAGDRVCYAQWSDCGPFLTDDVEYVFGDGRPTNPKNNGAGIDVSPAVRDYLGFKTNTKIDWRFVEVDEVPNGPWRATAPTTTLSSRQGATRISWPPGLRSCAVSVMTGSAGMAAAASFADAWGCFLMARLAEMVAAHRPSGRFFLSAGGCIHRYPHHPSFCLTGKTAALTVSSSTRS